ncbi:DHH family phosphoesterase [Candidatus Woesearchaeota archaeon]|nr:DHH family phosphoesterase [Candidatus Woesearchaeota archaeon]
MDKYERFKESVKAAADRFRQIPKELPVRVVSHFDADGITAAALLVQLLRMEDRPFHLSNVQHLSKQIVEELSYESYETIIFSDLGSGQLAYIDSFLQGKNIFILDHHIPGKDEGLIGANICQVNPLLHGIEGNLEISGAGVAYLFAKAVDPRMISKASMAIIGAIADQQEDNGFFGLNAEVLSDAIKMGNLTVSSGLRLFGSGSKPLHRVLEMATDCYIPGVTGSGPTAQKFLKDTGINPRHDGTWRTVSQLSEDEMQALVDAIIEKRKNEINPQDIFGNIYILRGEDRDSVFRDAREYATALNAAGRTGEASIGVAAGMGDKKAREAIQKSVLDYQQMLVAALRWLEENRGTDNFVQRDGFAYINSGLNISPKIIGTVSTILSKTGGIRHDSIIISMADTGEGMTKVSIRYSGAKPVHDLREICKKIFFGFKDAEFGGHRNAAGGIFRTEDTAKFIEAMEETLEKICMEDSVK